MNVLFLMDPLERVNPRKDTSFVLMIGARRRGHQTFFLPRGGISLQGERVLFDVEPVEPAPERAPPFARGEPRRLTAEEVDAVLVRSDPPFDASYLQDTWLLDRVTDQLAVVNAPGGLRAVNEKLWVTRFTELVPPTLASRRRDLLFAFLEEQGRVVAKPTDGFGGAGVFLLARGEPNAAVIFETLTGGWRREIIAQRYLPLASEGDKRILLLDGEPLGAVLRRHAPDDHRNNFFAGGTAHPAEISGQDRRIIATLAPHLRQLGLRFVGIDVIGGQLIEVNVTSPTCLQELNALSGGAQLEDQVIAAVEAQVRALRGADRS